MYGMSWCSKTWKQWADFYQPPSSSTIWHTEVNWSFIDSTFPWLDSTFPWRNSMWKQCFLEGLGDFFFFFCRSAAWLETKIVWCQCPGPALGAAGKKCAAQQAGSWVKTLWGLSLGKELGWPLQGTQVGEFSSPQTNQSLLKGSIPHFGIVRSFFVLMYDFLFPQKLFWPRLTFSLGARFLNVDLISSAQESDYCNNRVSKLHFEPEVRMQSGCTEHFCPRSHMPLLWVLLGFPP